MIQRNHLRSEATLTLPRVTYGAGLRQGGPASQRGDGSLSSRLFLFVASRLGPGTGGPAAGSARSKFGRARPGAIAGLARDWQQRYCIRPVLLETFCESARFRGTCYRAANWIHVGQTPGPRQTQCPQAVRSSRQGHPPHIPPLPLALYPQRWPRYRDLTDPLPLANGNLTVPFDALPSCSDTRLQTYARTRSRAGDPECR